MSTTQFGILPSLNNAANFLANLTLIRFLASILRNAWSDGVSDRNALSRSLKSPVASVFRAAMTSNSADRCKAS